MYLDHIKSRLEELHIVQPGDLVGCPTEDVQALEQYLGRPFPQAYREFLLWMGRQTGRLLAGSHSSCRDLPDLQGWAVELLQENSFPELLPKDAWVFLMHQGYLFNFFCMSAGDDPPVYHYSEGTQQTTFTVLYLHFSEFVLAVVEDYSRLRQNIAQCIAEVGHHHPQLAQRMAEDARRSGDFGDV